MADLVQTHGDRISFGKGHFLFLGVAVAVAVPRRNRVVKALFEEIRNCLLQFVHIVFHIWIEKRH